MRSANTRDPHLVLVGVSLVSPNAARCFECAAADDNEKTTDIFSVLSAVDLNRPEVQYVRFFCELASALNTFTVPVDALFEHILQAPSHPERNELAICGSDARCGRTVAGSLCHCSSHHNGLFGSCC
jgi:hypothetical protein